MPEHEGPSTKDDILSVITNQRLPWERKVGTHYVHSDVNEDGIHS